MPTKATPKAATNPSLRTVDAKARKILFARYWQTTGWIPDGQRAVEAADLAHAKAHGLMFDPYTGSHDDLVAVLRKAAAALTPDDVGAAFLASLSTRRLELRSGLASYAHAAKVTRHSFVSKDRIWCTVCRGTKKNDGEDINVLTFERHKWGGVRHGQPLYQYIDLTQLKAQLPVVPTLEDVRIFESILAAIAKTPKTDGPSKLEKRLAALLPSAKSERTTLIDILADAGVIAAKKTRSSPGDWGLAGMWRGEDGYDAAAVKRWFGASTKRR